MNIKNEIKLFKKFLAWEFRIVAYLILTFFVVVGIFFVIDLFLAIF